MPGNQPIEKNKLGLARLILPPSSQMVGVYFNQTMRIFLTGFMGAGKSYLGRHLAGLLGFAFIDLDEVIEAKMQMSVSEVFERFGEQAFRQMEAQCLRSLANQSKIVVATGGGAPCFQGNMLWMNEHGVTIFFNATAELLAERLQPEKAARPLLAGLPDDALRDFIAAKLAERMPFYEQCHLEFRVPAQGLEGVESLADFLKRFLS